MYGQPVLILELLEKLDQTDDPYNIGFEIIHHLYYIHQIGVHTDIKPENIMKISRMSEGKKKMFYYLIDFGGMSCDRFPGGGYRRFVWSPKWTAQIKPNWYKELGMEGKETEKVRQTCPRFDFIELGITMRVFQITSKLPTVPSDIDERYLHDYTKYKGRLKKYMEYVLSLPNSETYPPEVYRQIQDILSPVQQL
jgi:serine/threonine protein kinase